MYIQQLYTGCLAQACYYIESKGEAAIIDPLRDIHVYLDLLKSRQAKLKYVIETHFHADFVGGHIDLAHATDANIVFGPGAKPAYMAYVAKDMEKLQVGDLMLEIRHTPGHTLESICVVLYQDDKPHCVFTGDTLFIGDVGRPDLVQKVKADITPDYLAGKLFDSLKEQLMTLPDDTIVYPGHGAGSACGKHMSKETQDTIGNQKKFNYALNAALSREDFIQMVTKGLTEPPAYFPENVILNIQGSEKDIDTLVKENNRALSVEEVKQILSSDENSIILDTRRKEAFCEAHIPGSIFIGLDDNFAPWVGTIVKDLKTVIILITEPGRELEAVLRLSRVGYDHCIGYIDGGVQAWLAAGEVTNSLSSVTAEDYTKMYHEKNHILLDVRRQNEYDLAHVEGSQHIALDYLQNHLHELDSSQTYYVHCAGGYRSVIALSILHKQGHTKTFNILGGFNQLKEQSLPIVTNDLIEVIDI